MAISGESCRLCGGVVETRFRARVLNRHEVAYQACRSCGSLQTETPTWLGEAYATSLASSDVGAVQRCLTARAALWWILRILGRTNARLLDFGGGTGLLCRLLRDIGIDAWTHDRYGRGEFAQTYRIEPDAMLAGRFPIMTAFEVLEHLPAPKQDLDRLIAVAPEVLVTSTLLYTPALGPDWWYLAPSEGQHVFFYSRQALQQWAAGHGYHLVTVGIWQIFVKGSLGRLQNFLLSLVLRGKSLRLTRLFLEILPTDRHVAADYRACLQHNAASEPPRRSDVPAV
jgi:2-polyprenyl-3-methyl-5-hydroxy-6-metoxy-1,4-benzoquinol methylase